MAMATKEYRKFLKCPSTLPSSQGEGLKRIKPERSGEKTGYSLSNIPFVGKTKSCQPGGKTTGKSCECNRARSMVPRRGPAECGQEPPRVVEVVKKAGAKRGDGCSGKATRQTLRE